MKVLFFIFSLIFMSFNFNAYSDDLNFFCKKDKIIVDGEVKESNKQIINYKYINSRIEVEVEGKWVSWCTKEYKNVMNQSKLKDKPFKIFSTDLKNLDTCVSKINLSKDTGLSHVINETIIDTENITKLSKNKMYDLEGNNFRNTEFVFNCDIIPSNSSKFGAYSAETVFNAKGERIELKEDGTYINYGVPTVGDGFVFSIINAKPSKMEWGDKGEVESCKLTVKLVNNSQYNLKEAMTSFKSVDDLGQTVGTMRDASFSTVRKGESKIRQGLELFGKCSDLTSGFWNVKGDQNPYAFQVFEEGINTDDLLELVKYSNSGIVKFINASD